MSVVSTEVADDGAPDVEGVRFDVACFFEHRQLSRYNYVVLGLSCLAAFFDGLDLMLITFVSPYLRDDMGLANEQIGLVFSAGLAGMVAGGVLVGWLADKYGRRPLIISCAVAMSLLTAATSLAADFHQLLLIRFLSGVAIGGLPPLCWALNIECVSSRMRATVVTIIQVGYSFGAAAAGPLTSWLAPDHGWRMAYFAAGIASAAMTFAIYAALPESPRFLVQRCSNAKRIAALLARFGWRPSTNGTPAFVLGDSARLGEARVQERGTFRALFVGRLRWLTPILWLVYSASMLSVTFLFSWNPILFEGLGFPRAVAAEASALANLAGAILGLLLMRFTDRWGPASVAVYPAVACVLLLALGLLPLSREGLWYANVVALSFTSGAHFGILSITGNFYPTSVRATGTSFAVSLGKIVSVAGPMIGAALFAGGFEPNAIFAVFAAVPAIFVAGILALLATLRREVPTSIAPSVPQNHSHSDSSFSKAETHFTISRFRNK